MPVLPITAANYYNYIRINLIINQLERDNRSFQLLQFKVIASRWDSVNVRIRTYTILATGSGSQPPIVSDVIDGYGNGSVAAPA